MGVKLKYERKRDKNNVNYLEEFRIVKKCHDIGLDESYALEINSILEDDLKQNILDINDIEQRINELLLEMSYEKKFIEDKIEEQKMNEELKKLIIQKEIIEKDDDELDIKTILEDTAEFKNKLSSKYLEDNRLYLQGLAILIDQNKLLIQQNLQIKEQNKKILEKLF